jgi:hypothetical protein
MIRGRYTRLALLAGALALAAGGTRPALGAATPVTAPSAMVLTPGDGAVLVSFGGVLNAAGYNIYRRSGSQAVKVNDKPNPYIWFIDNGGGQGLQNGSAIYYSVKAVRPDGSEGPASSEAVTIPDPPLLGSLVVYDLTTPGTPVVPGSVTYDATKKILAIHSSGDDIWDKNDGQTFAAMPISGDFTIQAKLPTAPTGGSSDGYGKVGLEMRAGLTPGDPYALIYASVARSNDVNFEGRIDIGTSNNFGQGGSSLDETKYPLWLKLTRQGTMVNAQESFDGTAWTDVGNAQDFGSLSSNTYVGIAATAHDGSGKNQLFVDGQIDATSLSITTP